jgi:hypothetical protein
VLGEPAGLRYMRITDELTDEEIWQLERGLRKFAEAEGFLLATIHHEYESGHYGTFYELVAEVTRTQVRHVVLPSLAHLSGHPLLQVQLLRRLTEADTHAWVVEAVNTHESR